MPRAALRVAAIAATIASCTAPGGAPPREVVHSAAQTLPSAPLADAGALEREADDHAAIGRRDLAAPLYARAIELRGAGDEPPPGARALTALAIVEHDRGHLEEAEHFYRRALAEEFAEGGRDPALRKRTLANLAWLLGERGAWSVEIGRTAEAIGFYQQALEIWETLRPSSDELVAETLANLAVAHRARGERAKSRELLERALPIYEKTRPDDHATITRVRALMADYALRADPPDKNEPDAATMARDLDREGSALLDRRDYSRARPLLEHAVSIHERGVTAPVELGASLSYLGRTYAGLGERDAARVALERSLALLVPALGKLDPLTLATRAGLENLRTSAPASNAP
jgi:tetratricopeptide (TPR) repeat protein